MAKATRSQLEAARCIEELTDTIEEAEAATAAAGEAAEKAKATLETTADWHAALRVRSQEKEESLASLFTSEKEVQRAQAGYIGSLKEKIKVEARASHTVRYPHRAPSSVHC